MPVSSGGLVLAYQALVTATMSLSLSKPLLVLCTVDGELHPAHSEQVTQCLIFHRFNAEGMQDGIVSLKR